MKKAAFFYTDKLAAYSLGAGHPLKMERLRMVYDNLRENGIFDMKNVLLREQVPVSYEEVIAFHEPEYIEVLKNPEKNRSVLNRYGLGYGDNPAVEGIYECSLLGAGGSVGAARCVASHEADIAFNIAGGLHHAMRERASGFCYINDPVLAINELLKSGGKILYLDIDAHHGDGVQSAYYDTDKVLKISMHEHPAYLFPGTGYSHEIGKGKGTGYSVNLVMLPDSGDETFLYMFNEAVLPLIDTYSPDYIVMQLGADGLYGDPLSHLNISLNAYWKVISSVLDFEIPLVGLGGGGYNLANVSAAWAGAFYLMADRNGYKKMDRFVTGARLPVPASGILDIKEPDECKKEAERSIETIRRKVFPVHGI